MMQTIEARLKEAQDNYQTALETYNQSHSTRDWKKLSDAQEQIDRVMTDWFRQVEEQDA